jgi:predicted CXXCH cytochrome family protein
VNVKALASERVSAHAECTSCHDPHPNVGGQKTSASPGKACVRCHAETKASHPVAPSSAASADRGACVGCHPPHQKSSVNAGLASDSPQAVPCTSCHANAPDDRALHGHGGKTACTQCHSPHAFKLASRPDKRQLCAKCHASEVAATTTRAGHADCNGCHGSAHTPTPRPPCQSCHADESHSASRGHTNCTSCHDAHSGALGVNASCTSCHANKKNALHARLALAAPPGGESCTTCHRAHGPKGPSVPAPCTSCHSRASLGGLHSRDEHARCESCHSAHLAPRSDRATCTGSCHTRERGHQPGATSCKGCHLFRQ